MKYETIAVEREGALVTVRFNRPDKRNAVNRQMHADLQDLCHRLGDDPDARVVIFTGEGKGFSSGADTSEWTESQSANGGAALRAWVAGSAAIEIAQISSPATASRWAAAGVRGVWVTRDRQQRRVPIPKSSGLPLGWNALPRLAREMGHAKALELTITCNRFDAKTAHEVGLVTHLVAEGEHLAKTREIADKILDRPALPVALTKATMKSLKRGAEMGDAVTATPICCCTRG
jgi:enoyl-CoA hydratase/carnithine racemase